MQWDVTSHRTTGIKKKPFLCPLFHPLRKIRTEYKKREQTCSSEETTQHTSITHLLTGTRCRRLATHMMSPGHQTGAWQKRTSSRNVSHALSSCRVRGAQNTPINIYSPSTCDVQSRQTNIIRDGRFEIDLVVEISSIFKRPFTGIAAILTTACSNVLRSTQTYHFANNS